MDGPTLDALWRETQGDPRVCIAVLDGPVDLSHPCFAGADITVLETLASGPAHDGFAARHGTHVASVLFGQPGTSVRGIAPRCRGLIVPVFEGTAEGGVRACSQLDLARGIAQAAAAGANVINISGGQLDPSGAAETLLATTIQNCVEHGVLVVTAAGNDGCDCLHIPAAVPAVLVVGAMDARGEPLEFSNWGAAYQDRGVLAEGDAVVGAIPGGGVAAAGGTSFATPRVSGLAGLLFSVQLQRGERPDAGAVRRAILETAIGCDELPASDCRRLLKGRLSAVGALNYLTKGQIPMANDSHAASASVEAPAPAPVAAAAPQTSAGGCGCSGCKSAAPQLVYALGQLDYDFGTEANRDAFKQLGIEVPENRSEMAAYLTSFDEAALEAPEPRPVEKKSGKDGYPAELARWQQATKQRLRAATNLFSNQAHAEQLVWVLKQEERPMYAIQPSGPFAMRTYSRLVEFFDEQVSQVSERVSLPGYVVGKTKLLNGYEVPVVVPDARGLWNWSIEELIAAAFTDGEAEKTEEIKKEVENFLQRVYHEVRNLGLLPEQRALNFAATNIFQLKMAHAKALYDNLFDTGMKLDTFVAERSPESRPGADCWDIKLTFFQPAKRLEAARQVHRFTVDVSQVIPVTIGTIRSWHVN